MPHKKGDNIMEYGLQLYSVRDITQKGLQNAMQKVADLGYSFVEFAGFFGKINAVFTPQAHSTVCLTNLWASVATQVNSFSSRLKYTPFITGRNSSSAVAKMVLLMPFTKTFSTFMTKILIMFAYLVVTIYTKWM